MSDADAPFDGAELVDWRVLPPGQRRAWWERLWLGAVALADRYRLGLRSRWWEDSVQVEALAAFHCWLRMYDTGAETDPTGKLQLLWELERLRVVLRGGEHAFDPEQDRAVFDRYVVTLTMDPSAQLERGSDEGEYRSVDDVSAIAERLTELRERKQRLLADLAELGHLRSSDRSRTNAELAELERAVGELERLKDELSSRPGDRADGLSLTRARR